VVSFVKGKEIMHLKKERVIREISKASRQGEHPQRNIPFSTDLKGGEIEKLMKIDD
jgi:hypothetical protein